MSYAGVDYDDGHYRRVAEDRARAIGVELEQAKEENRRLRETVKNLSDRLAWIRPERVVKAEGVREAKDSITELIALSDPAAPFSVSIAFVLDLIADQTEAGS